MAEKKLPVKQKVFTSGTVTALRGSANAVMGTRPVLLGARLPAPDSQFNRRGPVSVRVEELMLPTFLPAAPDKNPMFLEKRVYQGSSGRVYPLPFTDRIAEKPVNRNWKAVRIENEYLRVLVLPEIGGRIHAIQDKTNGYDLIYNQPVIKPALVGLAGPWISGGIEFNWPQHHRPATFLPVDCNVENHADGSATIWCSDHDPMCRMKGMHGICLHPGKAVVELKVRVYNRTAFVHTFLWWANAAARVHEAYKSFFPPDVCYVADHARRSMSEYPIAKGVYYGINYEKRGRNGISSNELPARFMPPHAKTPALAQQNSGLPDYAPNDISFYANIPVPTSYMCMGSREDFFGGYDFKAEAGMVHIANHHISPGKKQWTWGNHDFGYAWDRNLTVADSTGEFAPYIEIMSGVFTDNQPDFSFLQPGETKDWSQFWYPIQKIGPAQQANVDAAVSLREAVGRDAGRGVSSRQRLPGAKPPGTAFSAVCVGVSVTRFFANATLTLLGHGRPLFSVTKDLAPGRPLVRQIKLPSEIEAAKLAIRVTDRLGKEIISYQPKPLARPKELPLADEPPPPENIKSTDELYLTGLHLDQYRHATRCPAAYWREALRRDPGDARSNGALGIWHLKRGEFATAETFLRRAIARLTRRNGNPADGEAYYHLGLCLRYLDRDQEAYDAFYKSVWNQAWQSSGYHALAELDCKRADWRTALEHLDRSLRLNAENLRARNLKAIALSRLGRTTDADAVLAGTRACDPLDWWARCLAGEPLECDLQTALDVAHDFARAGFYAEAAAMLESVSARPGDLPDQSWGAAPLVAYTLGWLYLKQGTVKQAQTFFKRAAKLPPDYCFPSRLEEIFILETAARVNPSDARAPYYLGNLFYDRCRHHEAIRLWQKSARLDPRFSIVWRNLGIGCFNILSNPAQARSAYDRAFRNNPSDARLLFERDQLWKRLGETPARRLRELEKYPGLVCQRDDLSLELCALLNQTGRHVEAMNLLARRNFQPWEGGEGGPLGQYVRTRLALGRSALVRNDLAEARSHFEEALSAPPNLGEAKHLLANQSDIHYWLGCALDKLGESGKARQHWKAAADFKGDFQEMSVRAFSEMTYYSALSLERLGRKAQAKKLFHELLAHARRLERTRAKIDYFATSLPAMLLFEDDLQFRQDTTALFIQAQAWLGLGQKAKGKSLLKKVLRRDPNHALAADLIQ